MGGDVRLDAPGSTSASGRAGRPRSPRSTRRGGTPYAIPAGASDHPLGGLGFANWALEVAAQEAELGIFFDHDRRVHGHRLDARRDDRRVRGSSGAPRRVLGIDALGDAGPDPRPGRAHRQRHRRRGSGSAATCAPTRSTWSTATPAASTASPTTSTVEAIHLAARIEGMLTDPVYEGKSMAGLIGLVRSGEIPAGSTVLYAHLGGQPALNAYSALFG